MKIPASWRRVEGAACEPERLEFEVPATPRQAAFMELRFERMEAAMAEAKFKSIATLPGAALGVALIWVLFVAALFCRWLRKKQTEGDT